MRVWTTASTTDPISANVGGDTQSTRAKSYQDTSVLSLARFQATTSKMHEEGLFVIPRSHQLYAAV